MSACRLQLVAIATHVTLRRSNSVGMPHMTHTSQGYHNWLHLLMYVSLYKLTRVKSLFEKCEFDKAPLTHIQGHVKVTHMNRSKIVKVTHDDNVVVYICAKYGVNQRKCVGHRAILLSSLLKRPAISDLEWILRSMTSGPVSMVISSLKNFASPIFRNFRP